jgi:hypothetical protein
MSILIKLNFHEEKVKLICTMWKLTGSIKRVQMYCY